MTRCMASNCARASSPDAPSAPLAEAPIVKSRCKHALHALVSALNTPYCTITTRLCADRDMTSSARIASMPTLARRSSRSLISIDVDNAPSRRSARDAASLTARSTTSLGCARLHPASSTLVMSPINGTQFAYISPNASKNAFTAPRSALPRAAPRASVHRNTKSPSRVPSKDASKTHGMDARSTTGLDVLGSMSSRAVDAPSSRVEASVSEVAVKRRKKFILDVVNYTARARPGAHGFVRALESPTRAVRVNARARRDDGRSMRARRSLALRWRVVVASLKAVFDVDGTMRGKRCRIAQCASYAR